MRTFAIAMITLGTIALPAAAQTPKPSVGSEQVYWVATFNVDQIDKFKPIVNKIVAATEKEPGTLAYEYTIGDDQKTVDIHERFANAHAAVIHVTENFGPNFSKEFLALAKPTRVVVYTAAPTDEPKKTLYMKPFDGFTR